MVDLELDPLRMGSRSRLVDDVLHRLRESILNHDIPAGAKLVQNELSERLGVSRTPLREAIRLLEQEGLVRVSDGNRTVEVVAFTGSELADLYQIREVIDGLAARLLARRGPTPEAERELSTQLEAMGSSISPLRGERFFTAHLAFHSGIILHCGNERLRSQLQLVRMTAASLRDEFPRRVQVGPNLKAADAKREGRRTQEEHRNILDAIRRGDEDGAEEAARVHIRTFLAYIPDSM